MHWGAFQVRSLMLLVASFATWLALFRTHPALPLLACAVFVPLLVLFFLERALDARHDPERRRRDLLCLLVALMGYPAMAAHLIVWGFELVP